MTAPQPRCSIVACARWESEAIVEWLLYHRSIGFDHVYLYCNDDDPDSLYQAVMPFVVGDRPFVTFIYFPYVGAQTQMYRNFLRNFADRVDWFIFLDIDEFVVLREDGVVSAFLAKREENADYIFINWLIFGHSGHKTRAAGSVLLNYTWRDRWINPYTKIFTKARCLDIDNVLATKETGFWHSWGWNQQPAPDRAVNVIGDKMTDYYLHFPTGSVAYLDGPGRQARILATAVINHYAFRSETDIARRIERGTGGDFDGQKDFQRELDAERLSHFLAQLAQVQDVDLKNYWRFMLRKSRLYSVGPQVTGKNLALGKHALQSSRCDSSAGKTPAEDASRLVAGFFAKAYNNHTDSEMNPWWMVDLETNQAIREIRIFNRIDLPFFRARAERFVLEASLDARDWVVLDDHSETPLDFGGTDGNPYIWRNPAAQLARFIRFRLCGAACLHLHAVEVYNEIAAVDAVDPFAYGPLTRKIALNSLFRQP